MSYPFPSGYLSTFESLVFDTPVETGPSEKDVAEELALWTNAQFTFDVKPGQGIPEDDAKGTQDLDDKNNTYCGQQPELDPITYEKLANYLDYELPRQQQQLELQQQQQLQQQAPVISAPPPTPSTSRPIAPRVRHQPLLLPKPVALDAAQLAALLQQQQQLQAVAPKPSGTNSAKKSSAGTKRSLSNEEKTEDQLAAEEDKRRRNTAASARFRIKKKLREQAMEQTVRDMTAKSERLQERVHELEREIKWLRSLLIEKNTSVPPPPPPSSSTSSSSSVQ